MVGSSSFASPRAGPPSVKLGGPHLLFWRRQRNALMLHLVDDGFGAFVAVGSELSGFAGERFKVLPQLDRLLRGGFLQSVLLCQRITVMDRVTRLERHQHNERN